MRRVPRYLELAADMEARIRSGETPVGGLMPTEQELCGRYAVSRYTVREALRVLAEKNLIARRQGSGTVVTGIGPQRRYQQSMTTTQHLLQYAQDATFRFLHDGEVSADQRLAEMLRCAPGTHWMKLHGIRRMADLIRPVCLTEVYLDLRFADVARTLEPGHGPLFVQLEAHYGVHVARIDQEFQAVALEPDQARQLAAEPATPALQIVRRYFEAGAAAPFEVSISVHPGDLFTYTTTLTNPA